MATESSPLPPGLRHHSLRTIYNPLQKETVYFAKYSAETGGAYTEAHVTLQKGGGVPPHFHTNSRETFTGGPKGCGIMLNNENIILKEGESATAEVGDLHRFYNHLDEEITFIGRIEGVNGWNSEEFEKLLYIMYGLARDGLINSKGLPKNPVHTAIMVAMGNTESVDMSFKLLKPFLQGLRWYGQVTGEEKRLLDKYWYIDAQEASPPTNSV